MTADECAEKAQKSSTLKGPEDLSQGQCKPERLNTLPAQFSSSWDICPTSNPGVHRHEPGAVAHIKSLRKCLFYNTT